MPVNLSAEKRHRQNQKRRLRNRIFKAKFKNLCKKLSGLITDNKKEEAEKSYRELISVLDKGVSKGIFHKNTAARKKTQLYRLLTNLA